MHDFAHIAAAPYTMVRVIKSADEVKAGRPAVAEQCAHCGASICNAVALRGADGREFVVGLDCAKRAGETRAKHAEAAAIATAAAAMATYARDFSLLASDGAWLDDRAIKPAALVRAFKPFAKLGLCAIVCRRDNFGGRLDTRVIFTAAGAAAFTVPGLIRRLKSGEAPEGWEILA